MTTVGTADEQTCLTQNDQLISPELPHDQLEKHLLEWNTLVELCPSEPHILHNMGVINAKLGNWNSAATYFTQSLEADPRSYQSYQNLNRIYRYQAVKAYRFALQSNRPEPEQPNFDYQPSTPKNSKEPVESVPDIDHSQLLALLTDWLKEKAEHNSETENSKPEYLLLKGLKAPAAVIHTKQRSYVLEFTLSDGRWQISQERSTP